jgi:hypothetical protein
VYDTPARDRTLDLAAFEPAVRTGGGRVVRTRIAAKGRVERGGGSARFRIDGWPDAYPIEGDGLPDGPCSVRAGARFERGAPRLHVVDDY